MVQASYIVDGFSTVKATRIPINVSLYAYKILLNGMEKYRLRKLANMAK